MLFEIVKDEYRKFKDEEIKLPIKMTETSAGWDIYSNEDKLLKPNKPYTFWTDIKVKLNDDEFLMIVPRSSIAINHNIMLANSVGIIDHDYYDNEDNDGNIGICMYNYGTEETHIYKGMRIAQGIPIKYINYLEGEHGIKRYGGFGSTGTD